MLELKAKKYPDKTTVNLVVRERTPRQISRAVCLFAILGILVALFCKFAVIDRLAAAARAEAAAVRAEETLARVQAANVDFDQVQMEYQRYFSKELSAEQAAAADCMDVLGLVEGKLMTSARVVSASFAGNMLSVQLSGVDLSRVSVILADLSMSPLVDGVEIYTADADGTAESATVSMTITLAVEGGVAP